MKLTAIISEYNPLHNGHIYHINKAKAETMPNLTMAIMSGNFTQRGKVSVLDKYTRAKLAINAGFDIVVELPTVFAVNNADCFSYGAINLLRNIPDVTLSFGSESGNIDELIKVTELLNTDNFNQLVKDNLQNGLSYPTCLKNALTNLSDSNALNGSNNILALEYLKNINKINPQITPHTIKRVDNFNNCDIVNGYLSATAIREMLKSNRLKEIEKYVPNYVYNELKNYVCHDKEFENMLRYKLFNIDTAKLAKIFDVSEGLENRIKSSLSKTTNFVDFMDTLSTKRYSKSKLNRIMLNALLDITDQTIIDAKKSSYFSVLAIKKSKLDTLSYLNNYAPVITKYADANKLDDYSKATYEIDRKANGLYNLINEKNIDNNMLILD